MAMGAELQKMVVRLTLGRAFRISGDILCGGVSLSAKPLPQFSLSWLGLGEDLPRDCCCRGTIASGWGLAGTWLSGVLNWTTMWSSIPGGGVLHRSEGFSEQRSMLGVSFVEAFCEGIS